MEIFITNRAVFDQAVHDKARELRDGDDFEFANQLQAAGRVIKKGGLAGHISTAINELTARAIAREVSPPISEDAVLVDGIKAMLYDLMSCSRRPQASAVQGMHPNAEGALALAHLDRH